MPQASNIRVVYDNFSGGDYGDLGGGKAPKNSFSAINMLVTADGFLCPRPGWKNVTSSTMPTGKVVGFTPTVTANRTLMLIIGNKVYTYDRDTASAVTDIGTLDVTPTLALYPKRGTAEYYITVPGDKSYRLLPVSNTIDPLSASPGGTEIEIYGERLLVAGAAAPNRIQFSDAADFDTWPAENFLDIPDDWQITSLREQANHLAIFKARGKHILTGVPGINPTRRKVERSVGVLHPGQAVLDDSDLVWFIPGFRRSPAQFDGSSSREISYLKHFSAARDGDTPALPLVLGMAVSTGDLTPSTILATQGSGQNKMLLQHNGIWTRHVSSISISGMTQAGETGDFYVTDGGAVGVAGKIYAIQFDLNRPSFTIDTFSQPGDNSTTPLSAACTLPQYWAPDGTEIKVEQVIVDFEKFNTGSAINNHFDIQIGMIGRIPAGKGDAPAVTYSWDEVASGSGASIGNSKRDRKAQGAKAAYASGYELSIQNVKGIKIKSITVELSIQKNRPVDH